MSVTASEVIAEARRLLDDPSGTRWNDSEIIDRLDQAHEEIMRLRPDLRLTATGSIAEVATISETGATLQIPRKYLRPLANLVAAYCIEDDNADEANVAMADRWRSAFYTVVQRRA